jgi:uncharacterized protein (UPF0332 family)
MQQATRQHLDRAARNQAVAEALADAPTSLGLRPPPFDWAVVAAFYAAVHYVNAYLWERYGVEPRTHAERARVVATDPNLKQIFVYYDHLSDLGFHARYTRTFRVSRADVQHALHTDLERVARAILTLLGVAKEA